MLCPAARELSFNYTASAGGLPAPSARSVRRRSKRLLLVNRRYAIVLIVALATLSTHQPVVQSKQPLLDFSYADTTGSKQSGPEMQQCGYYLLIRGTIGHSGGYRPGAFVELRGDTLLTRVGVYRAFDFVTRDWRLARWTLRIGALGSRPYHVNVFIAGQLAIEREARLSAAREPCAA